MVITAYQTLSSAFSWSRTAFFYVEKYLPDHFPSAQTAIKIRYWMELFEFAFLSLDTAMLFYKNWDAETSSNGQPPSLKDRILIFGGGALISSLFLFATLYVVRAFSSNSSPTQHHLEKALKTVCKPEELPHFKINFSSTRAHSSLLYVRAIISGISAFSSTGGQQVLAVTQLISHFASQALMRGNVWYSISRFIEKPLEKYDFTVVNGETKERFKETVQAISLCYEIKAPRNGDIKLSNDQVKELENIVQTVYKNSTKLLQNSCWDRYWDKFVKEHYETALHRPPFLITKSDLLESFLKAIIKTMTGVTSFTTVPEQLKYVVTVDKNALKTLPSSTELRMEVLHLDKLWKPFGKYTFNKWCLGTLRT